MEKKCKVLMIIPNRDILQVRPIKIAKTLSQNGYDVKILTCDMKGNRAKTEYINGCKIYNFRLKTQNRVMLYISYLILWWPYIFLFILLDDSEILHPYNFFVLIPTVLANIVKRKKVIYDLADFCSEGLSPDVPKFVRSLLFWLERFFIGFVDGVIIVDEMRKKYLKGTNVKTLEIIMNCPQDFSNIFNVKLKKRKKNGEFCIYYGGWLSEKRGIKQIIRAIDGLEDVKLIVAGFGPDEHKLKLLFNTRKNVNFVGMIPYEESIRYTFEADVVIAFYDPQIPINRLASPNKLFEAMMCGTPIIVNSEAIPVAKIVIREKCGLVVPYNDIQGLRNAILKLKKNINLRIKLGLNGRKAFEREYNWAEMERRLLKFYEGFLSKKYSKERIEKT